MSLSGAVFEYDQAADFDRLKIVLNNISLASFTRSAASLSSRALEHGVALG